MAALVGAISGLSLSVIGGGMFGFGTKYWNQADKLNAVWRQCCLWFCFEIPEMCTPNGTWPCTQNFTVMTREAFCNIQNITANHYANIGSNLTVGGGVVLAVGAAALLTVCVIKVAQNSKHAKYQELATSNIP